MKRFILSLLAAVIVAAFFVARPAEAQLNSCFNSSWWQGAVVYFTGGGCDSARSPIVYKSLSAVVVTTETTIWTPAAGKKFRLMGFCLAQGVATGAITLKDNTAGTTIFTVPQNTVGVAVCSPDLKNGILSATANNVLTATGVSTETITGTIWGTEE